MQDIFNNVKTYSNLSITDLLTARDQYHYHLMNKENVVATAIGYYRIRKAEPWPERDNKHPNTSAFKNEPRTLQNSEVRPYSWPAVLVFVSHWKTLEQLATEDPSHIVPKTLFMGDGRSVPVCVIWAEREEYTDIEVDESKLEFPRNIIGGGFPLITYTQEERHIASVGCLVTDGHLTYALTNKHVAGDGGETIYSKLAGVEIPIGVSTKKQVGRVPFSELYPGWPGRNVYVNMDIGLIQVKDVRQWKAEVYDIGTMGRLADLSTGNLNLNLIGASVIGYGAVSKKIEGEIQAIFYRYKSVGGYEYLSDFLVGPKDGKQMNLHAGDSGTILLYERYDEGSGNTELMPIGVLWGQHSFVNGQVKTKQPYALVNCLSLALNQLDVDLVRGWNLDVNYTWGRVGHYSVALKAINAIDGTKFPGLKKFMSNNAKIISFERNMINKKLDDPDFINPIFKKFCPLADVPDVAWKMGGTGIQRGGEKPNHYADIDLPRDSDGESLRTLFEKDKKNLDPKIWKAYYDEIGTDTMHQGILPFRVWQIFNAMVDYIKAGDRNGFVGAAGVLTHYMGDACQPLHSSYMSQGEKLNDGGKIVMFANGVHSYYEEKMIDDHYDEILKGLDTAIPKNKEKISKVTTGKDAAESVMKLMCKTMDDLPPETILTLYKKDKTKLWSLTGDKTIGVMARGCRYLANLWEAAWEAANGEKKIKQLGAVDPKDIKDLYEKHRDDFIPSVSIKNIGDFLK